MKKLDRPFFLLWAKRLLVYLAGLYLMAIGVVQLPRFTQAGAPQSRPIWYRTLASEPTGLTPRFDLAENTTPMAMR